MITTVTLNAAIDKAYQLDGPLVRGTVMRVKEVRQSAGGKGLNVARVIKRCGQAVQATGLVGGFNGAYLESLLKKDGVPACFTETASETRSCVNILDSTYGSTELLEPGAEVSQEEWQRFCDQYKALLNETTVVTLSGSLPKGLPVDSYRLLIEWAKEAGKVVILDSSGQAFQEGLLAKPTLVKPNQDELEAFFNTKIETLEDTLCYAKKLADEGISYVVISLGGEGALLLHDGKIYHGCPPKIKPVNTVGCGDSMVGALAIGLGRGDDPETCLRYAIAVGTANALSPATGDFDPADLDWLLPEIRVRLL